MAARSRFFPGFTRVDVAGNVEIDSNNQAQICSAHITGDVVISNTNPGPLFLGISCGRGDIIDGNVSIANNNASSLIVANSTIGKNMSVTDNVGTRPKTVAVNTVTGNLECSGNQTPFSIDPTGNTSLKGKLIGQCAQ
jgi:hypothetical protein